MRFMVKGLRQSVAGGMSGALSCVEVSLSCLFDYFYLLLPVR